MHIDIAVHRGDGAPLFLRLWRCLGEAITLRRSAWCVPMACGLWSLILGQDVSWDLLNYHLYNPFALLNGKIGVDLAPAQWQSYFNPALDVFPYLLYQALPAPAVGWLLGCLHGLNFPLLLAVLRRLPGLDGDNPDMRRRSLLLSCAGCLGAGFLMEIGNAMGDNLTALGVLGSAAIVLGSIARPGYGPAAPQMLMAGMCCGAATGLKLTNAPYALAICLTLLVVQGPVLPRLRSAFVYGCGVIAGIGITAGYWYWRMWQLFDNPLFPQFNDRFRSPLAAPIGIGDPAWLPNGILEKLLWPFIFTLHPKRVIEIPLRQIIWPLLYIAFIVLAIRLIVARRSAKARLPLPSPILFLLVFFALAYVLWLSLFSIYRYLIPLELLAPTVFYLLLAQLLPEKWAARSSAALLLLALFAVFPLGNWGHIGWSRSAFRIQAPVIASPEQSIAFLVQGDPPLGWLSVGFPSTLALVSLGAGFPESAGYRARVTTLMNGRKGPFYVILHALHPLAFKSDMERQHADQRNRETRTAAREKLASYGLSLDESIPCTPFTAFTGRQRWTYDLCPVRRPD